MGTKLNIFTGQLDITGSSSGPVDSFTTNFNGTTDWVGPTLGYYTITYLESVHGKGTSPAVQIFELDSGNYNEVDVDRIQVNSLGDVEIRVPSTPDLRFVGKVIIL